MKRRVAINFLHQTVDHDGHVHAQMKEGRVVEAVHGEVSKGSRWSIPDLLGQFWVTLPLFFNDGVQQPCHL